MGFPMPPRLLRRRRVGSLVFVALLVSTGVWTRAWQTPPAAATDASPSVPDYTIESYRSAIVVATGGGYSRETTVRLKVNTQDGLTAVGTLEFVFERDLSTLVVRYVRVRKADGTVVDTPLDSAIDVPGAITQQAPSYTDLYERHINVRGLAVGDVIEYSLRSDDRPLIPGHLAIEEEWLVGEAVVDGEVTLSAPTSMALTVKTHDRQPVVTEQGGRRVYRWTFAHPADWTTNEIQDLVVARRSRRAAVQVSSFASWAQVGEATQQLWRDRAAVTPAIRQKAEALTAGKVSEAEKLSAIYQFVSRDVRYVAVSFGIGRYQPHPADEVLANGFGDCKDKHVLLEALLRAAGVESVPVLVAPGAYLDTDVPSPFQFSHVMTRVEATGGPVWMDATLGAVPVGYLPFLERDRDGLAVPARGSAALVRTPAEARPRPTEVVSTITGTLDGKGTLAAQFEDAVSGDVEFGLRTALRTLSESQRVQALQRAYTTSLGFTVTDMAISDLDDLSGPVRINGRMTVPNYSQWSTGYILPPLPHVVLPEVGTEDDAGRPIALGTPARYHATVRLQLPSGYEVAIDGKPAFERSEAQSFATYRLSLAVANNVLTAERTYDVKTDLVLAAQASEYDAYRKVAVAAAPWVLLRDAWPWQSTSVPRFQTLTGTNTEASQLVAQAQRSSSLVAVGLLEKAVALEPTHPSAWSLLGQAMSYTGRLPEGEATMRRQLTVAPSADAYKRIGTTYMAHLRWPIAIAALREGAEKYPDDRDMPAMLGEALLNNGQPAEAVPVIEAEVERRPRSSRLRLALGRAYLRTGDVDKGVAALHAAVEREAGPNIMSVAAYELAGVRRDLPRALDYAERAIKQTLTENELNEFVKLGRGASDAARRLAFYYEALGRVLAAQGTLDRGRTYCQAAWDLAYRTRAAECLVDIARTRKDTAEVERQLGFMRHGSSFYMPAGAWDAGPQLKPVIPTPPAEARATLAAWRAIDATRTFRVPRPSGAIGRGNFEVITGPDGKVREARMFSSAREYETVVGDLLNRQVGPALPEGGQTRLIRIARVVCDEFSTQAVVTTDTVTRTGPAVTRQSESSGPAKPPAMCTVRIE